MYENIKNAINPGSGKGLSTQQQAENYDLFGKLMKEGVYLPDLIKKVDSLEAKINDLEKPKVNPMDAELFAVMEASVKDDPAVIDAKRKLQNEKTRVISELCMKDEAYRRSFDEYRRTVNQAYVSSKEK